MDFLTSLALVLVAFLIDASSKSRHASGFARSAASPKAIACNILRMFSSRVALGVSAARSRDGTLLSLRVSRLSHEPWS